MDDDAWFEDDGVSEQAELERERRIRHERAVKKGFREGVTADTSLQQQSGFAAGYRSGLKKAMVVGFLEGCINVRQQLHGSAEDYTAAANAAKAAHKHLRTAAFPATSITKDSPFENTRQENQFVAPDGPMMGSIAEEPLGSTEHGESYHLVKAETAVTGFAYGPFPECIVL